MRLPLRGIVGLALALGAWAAADAAPSPAAFSIEDVLSAPFPSDLVSSPSGAVAWVFTLWIDSHIQESAAAQPITACSQ